VGRGVTEALGQWSEINHRMLLLQIYRERAAIHPIAGFFNFVLGERGFSHERTAGPSSSLRA
jgi:hypothetical protein